MTNAIVGIMYYMLIVIAAVITTMIILLANLVLHLNYEHKDTITLTKEDLLRFLQIISQYTKLKLAI